MGRGVTEPGRCTLAAACLQAAQQSGLLLQVLLLLVVVVLLLLLLLLPQSSLDRFSTRLRGDTTTLVYVLAPHSPHLVDLLVQLPAGAVLHSHVCVFKEESGAVHTCVSMLLSPSQQQVTLLGSPTTPCQTWLLLLLPLLPHPPTHPTHSSP